MPFAGQIKGVGLAVGYQRRARVDLLGQWLGTDMRVCLSSSAVRKALLKGSLKVHGTGKAESAAVGAAATFLAAGAFFAAAGAAFFAAGAAFAFAVFAGAAFLAGALTFFAVAMMKLVFYLSRLFGNTPAVLVSAF